MVVVVVLVVLLLLLVVVVVVHIEINIYMRAIYKLKDHGPKGLARPANANSRRQVKRYGAKRRRKPAEGAGLMSFAARHLDLDIFTM